MLTKEVDWVGFKQLTAGLYGAHLFRGQTNGEWSLQTSYHRSVVSRLSWDRYYQEVVFNAVHSLADLAPAQFKSVKENILSEDFWICLPYLQHYGFPTPMLDWTASPYVAAYFAFKDSINRKEGTVAIYSIWNSGPLGLKLATIPKGYDLNNIDPGIQIFRCDSSGNSRSISQQSYMMICRDSDVESALSRIISDTIPQSDLHFDSGLVKYILPVSEVKKSLNDLNAMNINGATIWDNIDGICEHLKTQAELIAI